MKKKTTNLRSNWSLNELQMSIIQLRSLFATDGMTPAEITAEMANLEPKRAEFWRGANRHVLQSYPLHSYLEGRWPPMFSAPMKIANDSGMLEDVLKGMQESIKQQLESQKMVRRLWYPFSVVVAGALGAILFLILVVPRMLGSIRMEKEPFISILSRTVNEFLVANGNTLGMAAATAILLLYWKWKKDTQLHSLVLQCVGAIPGVGRGLQWIWFSVWAKYVAIMLKAELSWEEVLKLSVPTLPLHLQNIPVVIAAQLAASKSLDTVAIPGKDPADPRHAIPIHIRNAFRMTNRTGNGEKQFNIASSSLFEPGTNTFAISIAVVTTASMLFAAVVISIPFVIYMQILTASMTAIR